MYVSSSVKIYSRIEIRLESSISEMPRNLSMVPSRDVSEGLTSP